MKRLLLFTPLLLVLAACGGTQRPSGHPVLSHTARLGDVPLRVDVAGAHRVGRVVAVDLRLANRAPAGADAFSIDDTFSSMGDYDAGGVLLLDSRTGAQAEPIAASRADLGMLDVAPGGTQLIRVEFAAPSSDTADVLVPHFGLYRDVPVR